MTIKLKLFFMFIMLPPLLYGQNKLVEESIIYSSDISSYKKKIEKTIFFDTETNLPVFELILDTARSSKMYFFLPIFIKPQFGFSHNGMIYTAFF